MRRATAVGEDMRVREDIQTKKILDEATVGLQEQQAQEDAERMRTENRMQSPGSPISGAGARASTAEGERTGEDTDENGASIYFFHAR